MAATRRWAVVVGLLLAALALVDLTQGSAGSGIRDGLTDGSVLLASRLPRTVAGILVGAALGTAGSALQAVSRNVLASPDTLAVNAGSYLALGVLTASGLSVPLLASSGVAFLGGLLAAAIVLGLSGLGSGTVRLVLAGSALALGFDAVTNALLLLFPQRTTGLYLWSRGSIAQNGFGGVEQMAPLVVVGVAGLLLVAHRVDALGLGDDAASGVGVPVRNTRIIVVVLTSLLAAAAVTLAGPIGFVGLCAPALTRHVVRARLRMPAAGLVGALLVLGSDVLLRALIGGQDAVSVPTGVVTSLVGAAFLVGMAVRAGDAGGTAEVDRLRVPGRVAFAVTTAVLVVLLLALGVVALLLGDTTLLLGDVVNWVAGRAGHGVDFVLDTRLPRVLAALLAGGALALAGTMVQAVTRNPLAEPGILGVSGGAGLGAVLLVTTVPTVGSWGIAGAAGLGAAAAAALVFGLAARGGFPQNRVVLVGIGVSTAATALISLLIVLTDPFDATKALTWLSGSTYGRTMPDVLPVTVVLVLATGYAATRHRQLDLVALDDDTPRLLGLPLGRTRLVFLAVSVLLSAAAVAATGTIGFVGLVAPHAARALVGRRHARVLPTAILLGAALVCCADLVGRTVIAPAQLGAGLVTAVIGPPYFVHLLFRSRRR